MEFNDCHCFSYHKFQHHQTWCFLTWLLVCRTIVACATQHSLFNLLQCYFISIFFIQLWCQRIQWHIPLALHTRMPEQSINKYVWQWGVTIQKTIADRFSASNIVSDGRSMSEKVATTMLFSPLQAIQHCAACAEFVPQKMHIWTFVHDIRSNFCFVVRFHYMKLTIRSECEKAAKKTNQNQIKRNE